MEQHTNSALLPLYHHYAENRGVDGTQMRLKYKQLYGMLADFSPEKRDAVEVAVNELCCMTDCIAFLDGLRLGARLMRELMDEKEAV